MKTGRRIHLKSESLRKIRTNLRKLFYTTLGGQALIQVSICRCYRCGSFEKDAVFWSQEMYYPMYYPPVNVKETPPKTFWLCPECYEKEMDSFNYYQDKKYYFFHQDGTFASLEELGIDKLEDY